MSVLGYLLVMMQGCVPHESVEEAKEM